MKRPLPLLFLAVFTLFAATAAPADDAVDAILASQALSPEEPVWDAAMALKRLGPQAEEDIAAIAADRSQPVPARLAAGAALLQLGSQREGALALEAAILDELCPLGRRLEAAQLLGKWGGEYATARLGILMDGPGLPERLRVELAYNLWKLSSRPQAYALLEEIRLRGSSPLARAEALLALAQTERFPALRDEVRNLSEMPGAVGERANHLLLINARLDDEVRRDDFTVKLLSEVVQKVRDFYAFDEDDEEQVKRLQPKSLGETSAQALLYSLDQFNDYLNEEDYADFDTQLKANYGGIGAYVGMRDSRFTILSPMYNKPAHQAGLRPMDVIDRVDDVDITEMKLNDIIKMLKGEPNTSVKVRVLRRDWKEPRTVPVKREIVQIDSVLSQALPGDIGYIKINSFNEGDPFRRIKSTAGMVKDALTEFNRLGVKGVILDLAYNPGGVMISGVDVAKLFIGDSKLIVSSRGRRNERRTATYKAGFGRPFYRNPVVAVVNEGTASAAEIVAGAMRDHKRAPLVGRKTYGKGSVQSLMPIGTMRDRARIKLTVAKYYLPNGETIHRKGIEPDRVVPELDLSFAEAEARGKIRDQHDVYFWLEEDNRFERHEQTYRRLLEFDAFDASAYPDFDQLHNALVEKYPKEKIDRELVRKEIRYGLISYLRDFKGESRYVDLEENPEIQEAVMTLGEAIGGLPDTPLFAAIAKAALENRAKAAEGDLVAEGK
ncbi:MAG: PDZ domain-containing protein [Planctomycetota bacterium]|jgi:carboxyl-terminal processing protease|nr:PDZ domain-containing protein [Planctomycetota bacterium]